MEYLLFPGMTIVGIVLFFGMLFGTPPYCEKPVCHMKSCQSFKNGKPNGSICSNDCHKECCRCTKSCNRH